MKTNEYLFREMPVRRAVLSLAIPTVLSQLITLIYNIADTFFIGQLNDPRQVAAASVSIPAFMMLTAIANLFGIGGASKISRCLGRGETEHAKKSAAFSFWGVIAVAALYGGAVFFLRPWLLPLLGAKTDTYEFAASYVFWTVTIGAIPTSLSATMAHLVRTEGYSKQAGFGVALGGVLNIALDPIFIFLFRLNIAGAAIATMLSNLVAMVYFLLFLRKIRKNTVLIPKVRNFSCRNGIAVDILLGGLPSFMMMLLGSISNSVLNQLLTGVSTEAMAGMGIAKRIDMIAFAVAQGMTQGVLPLIAYNYASGNRKRMTDSIRVTLTYALCFAFTAMTALYLFASPITRCFIDDDVTVEYGKKFLRIICFICPSTAINYMFISVFQATKQKVQSMILSFLRKGSLDIPMMIGFSRLGVEYIPWATPISDWLALVVSICLFIPFLKKMWKTGFQEGVIDGTIPS